MQERITTTKKGSITSVQAIYVPADDLTDPAPATTFAHLDATTVLSRAIAELGIYPAVDPLDSTSRIMDPNIIGAEHYQVARNIQKILQDYKSLQDIIAILGKHVRNMTNILIFLFWMNFVILNNLYLSFPKRYGRVVRRGQINSIKSSQDPTFLISTIPGTKQTIICYRLPIYFMLIFVLDIQNV